MDNFFIKREEIPEKTSILLKKLTSPIKVTPTTILGKNFLINIPEFTNLNAKLTTKDFFTILNSRNSTIEIFDDSILLTKQIGNSEIVQTIKTDLELKTFNEEILGLPIASFNLSEKIRNILKKSKYKSLEFEVSENKIKISADEGFEKFQLTVHNVEMQIFKQEFKVKVRGFDFNILKIDFEKHMLCFFEDFMIIYLYEDDVVSAVAVEYCG